jgi:hypothetical protein
LKILQALEPAIFNDDLDTRLFGHVDLCCYVARLVGAQMRSELPTTTHNIPITHEVLITALSQHYKQTGGGLIVDKTIANVKAGYFKTEGTKVTCCLDKGVAKKGLEFPRADQISIEEPLDCMSQCVVKTGGREMTISLAEEFEKAGLSFPKLVVDWKGDMMKYAAKRDQTVTPPEARKRLSDGQIKSPRESQASSASADPAITECQRLEAALRRTSGKRSPGKSCDGRAPSPKKG